MEAGIHNHENLFPIVQQFCPATKDDNYIWAPKWDGLWRYQSSGDTRALLMALKFNIYIHKN